MTCNSTVEVFVHATDVFFSGENVGISIKAPIGSPWALMGPYRPLWDVMGLGPTGPIPYAPFPDLLVLLLCPSVAYLPFHPKFAALLFHSVASLSIRCLLQVHLLLLLYRGFEEQISKPW